MAVPVREKGGAFAIEGAALIELRDVAVTFGRGTPNENRALAGLSLTIDKGEFVTVIGSNGAGKSTLLNAIAGEAPLDGGTIRLGTADVSRTPPHVRARLIARVFQDPLAGTCGPLSIEENMALATHRTWRRTLRSALRGPDRTRFRQDLARLGLGLEERLGDQAGLLSGGQRQALSLLMATLAPSQILLLDEHTAALDPKASQLVLSRGRRPIRGRRRPGCAGACRDAARPPGSRVASPRCRCGRCGRPGRS